MPAEVLRMGWESPAFDEIKMDAELTAYCDDLEETPAAVEDVVPPCESAS
jgi:hypothetical protein